MVKWRHPVHSNAQVEVTHKHAAPDHLRISEPRPKINQQELACRRLRLQARRMPIGSSRWGCPLGQMGGSLQTRPAELVGELRIIQGQPPVIGCKVRAGMASQQRPARSSPTRTPVLSDCLGGWRSYPPPFPSKQSRYCCAYKQFGKWAESTGNRAPLTWERVDEVGVLRAAKALALPVGGHGDLQTICTGIQWCVLATEPGMG